MRKFNLTLSDEHGVVHGSYVVVVAMDNDEIDSAWEEANRLEDEESKVVFLHVLGGKTLDNNGDIAHDINVVAKRQ